MLTLWIVLSLFYLRGSGWRWASILRRRIVSAHFTLQSATPFLSALFAAQNPWGNAFEDADEYNTFFRIATSYLENKLHLYFSQQGSTSDNLMSYLTAILPPVTEVELANEVQRISKDLATLSESEDAIVQAVFENEYWRAAGQRVVFELIYLDCVYANYYQRERGPLLRDDDYDDLKSALNWEGSALSSVTAKEALFISAVAAFHRNQPLLTETEYKTLKEELQAENSWVVRRVQDPLERLGLNTFLGYLHRSLKGR